MLQLVNIRKFYTNPPDVQWIQAFLLLITSLILITLCLIYIEFPFLLFLIPIVKPIIHFLITPILKLTGWLNYHSPMFLTIKKSKKQYEIHNGNVFDYFTRMKWNFKGSEAKKRIINDYLRGLLKIINDIENNKLSPTVKFSGVSYFINRNTARKLGFSVTKARLFHKILFITDFINLFLMYSFAQGTFSFPDIKCLKKMEISGEKLLNAKSLILEILLMVNKKNGTAY